MGRDEEDVVPGEKPETGKAEAEASGGEDIFEFKEKGEKEKSGDIPPVEEGKKEGERDFLDDL